MENIIRLPFILELDLFDLIPSQKKLTTMDIAF